MNGWENVGEGYFGEVFSKPSIDYVVKLFERDSAYLAYLKLITSSNNKHFPKVRGKFYISKNMNTKYNAVRLEKLVPCDSVMVNGYKKQVSSLLTYYAISLRDPKEWKGLDFAKAYLSDKPELKRAIEEINDKLLDKFKLDISHGNVMQRSDGTVVIVDPIYY